jgi:hypothetical protein
MRRGHTSRLSAAEKRSCNQAAHLAPSWKFCECKHGDRDLQEHDDSPFRIPVGAQAERVLAARSATLPGIPFLIAPFDW